MKQDTPEWLEMRKGKIGASDAPIIMGDSPWTTPMQLWEEKMGLRPSRPMNAAMQRGKEFEPHILFRYNQLKQASAVPTVMVHPDYPWMMASLDGWDTDCAVEIKTANAVDHAEAKKGIVPKKYWAQLQHQLAVTCTDCMYYFSWHSKSEEVLLLVFRNEEYIERLIKAELEFWEGLQSFCPPESTAKDHCIRSDAEWKQAAAEYTEAKAVLDAAEHRIKASRQRLIDLAAGTSSAGCGVKVSAIPTPGRVDYKKIPELASVDLSKYRGQPTMSWRVTT